VGSQNHRALREIPRPLDLAFRKAADPGIGEVRILNEDAKKRLSGVKA